MVTPPSEDGADWSSDKTTFVESWAGRIDAYLAGSPLSGQGAVFAAAAWDYGVDPRFSPAMLPAWKVRKAPPAFFRTTRGAGDRSAGEVGKRLSTPMCAVLPGLRVHVERGSRQEILSSELAALVLSRRGRRWAASRTCAASRGDSVFPGNAGA